MQPGMGKPPVVLAVRQRAHGYEYGARPSLQHLVQEELALAAAEAHTDPCLLSLQQCRPYDNSDFTGQVVVPGKDHLTVRQRGQNQGGPAGSVFGIGGLASGPSADRVPVGMELGYCTRHTHGSPAPQGTAEECCEACRTHSSCTVWVWCSWLHGCGESHRHQECWLKREVLEAVVRQEGNPDPSGWAQSAVECSSFSKGQEALSHC